MPKAVVDACPSAQTIPIESVADALIHAAKRRPA